MRSFRSSLIAAAFACIVLIFGCSGRQSNTGRSSGVGSANRPIEPANSAKTNVEELGVLVNIPYEVEDIAWKEDATDKKLIAVLRFSPADAAKVVAEAEKIRSPQPVNLSSETWFPVELIAQSAMSGDDSLNGKSYAANSFLQEPYRSGTITRVDNTDYFVLELSAK